VRREESAASTSALWWPPGKIAGRYLAPYLATARPSPLGASPLADRPPARRHPPDADSEAREALELALILAEHDARWEDYELALQALDAAEALAGTLPPEYEAKRRRWRQHLKG
jgi:sulfide:quinone oxidoreductase